VSNDTSVCYEDYTPNLNENVADIKWPVCKKRKIHAEERVIQKDIVKEKPVLDNSNDMKPVLDNSNGYEKSQEQQNNQIQKHYKDALTLTTYIQPPNLSDSDSNDTFPITNDKASVYRM